MRERELGRARELIRLEPSELREIVTGARLSSGAGGPGEAEHDASVVGLEPEPEELEWLDLEARLLPNLPTERIERVLVLVQEPARQIPEAGAGIERAPPEQDSPTPVEADALRPRHGVAVTDEATGTALGAVLDLLDSLAADGTEAPAVESTHGENHMSPRAAGATQHELSRIGLLATLSGETLARLAQRMTREDIPAGAGVVAEGEEGDRFYVLLSGMLSVSQQTRGAQSVLRPGDYFGEVALAMGMPRTASVRALTPATVASCDRETFDEFVRPLSASLELALESPDRVSALVLVGSGLDGHDWSEQVRSFGASEGAALQRGDLDAAIELNLRMWLAGPNRSLDEIPAEVREQVAEMQRDAFRLQKGHYDLRADQLDPPASARLGEVRAPTLVVTGEEDVADIHGIADRLVAEISEATRATIPGAAHLPNLERPDEFDRIVLGFLVEHGV